VGLRTILYNFRCYTSRFNYIFFVFTEIWLTNSINNCELGYLVIIFLDLIDVVFLVTILVVEVSSLVYVKIFPHTLLLFPSITLNKFLYASS